MKISLLAFAAFIIISPKAANAAEVNSACYAKAEAAVKNQAEPGYYDADGIDALDCVIAPNKKAVVCEVGAYKGNGAAADSYRVVLNASCTKVFRVELTGEE